MAFETETWKWLGELDCNEMIVRWTANFPLSHILDFQILMRIKNVGLGIWNTIWWKNKSKIVDKIRKFNNTQITHRYSVQCI